MTLEFLRGLDGIEQRSTDDDFDDDFDDDQDVADEPYYENDHNGFNYFQQGQLIRHPKFGLGRIKEIFPNGEDTKVIIQFNNGPQKTLFLKYANLENLDFKN